jgi:hypothetical protein
MVLVEVILVRLNFGHHPPFNEVKTKVWIFFEKDYYLVRFFLWNLFFYFILFFVSGAVLFQSINEGFFHLLFFADKIIKMAFTSFSWITALIILGEYWLWTAECEFCFWKLFCQADQTAESMGWWCCLSAAIDDLW